MGLNPPTLPDRRVRYFSNTCKYNTHKYLFKYVYNKHEYTYMHTPTHQPTNLPTYQPTPTQIQEHAHLWEPWVGHTLGPTCEEPMPSNLEESATEGHYIYHGKPRKTTKGHGRSRQATGGHGRSRDTMGHHVKPLYLTRNHRSMLSLGSILGPPTDQSLCGRPCVTYCRCRGSF